MQYSDFLMANDLGVLERNKITIQNENTVFTDGWLNEKGIEAFKHNKRKNYFYFPIKDTSFCNTYSADLMNGQFEHTRKRKILYTMEKL